MAQVIECLSGTCEVLSSNPSTAGGRRERSSFSCWVVHSSNSSTQEDQEFEAAGGVA
jgi:hypothetical protein